MEHVVHTHTVCGLLSSGAKSHPIRSDGLGLYPPPPLSSRGPTLFFSLRVLRRSVRSSPVSKQARVYDKQRVWIAALRRGLVMCKGRRPSWRPSRLVRVRARAGVRVRARARARVRARVRVRAWPPSPLWLRPPCGRGRARPCVRAAPVRICQRCRRSRGPPRGSPPTRARSP